MRVSDISRFISATVGGERDRTGSADMRSRITAGQSLGSCPRSRALDTTPAHSVTPAPSTHSLPPCPPHSSTHTPSHANRHAPTCDHANASDLLHTAPHSTLSTILPWFLASTQPKVVQVRDAGHSAGPVCCHPPPATNPPSILTRCQSLPPCQQPFFSRASHLCLSLSHLSPSLSHLSSAPL